MKDVASLAFTRSIFQVSTTRLTLFYFFINYKFKTHLLYILNWNITSQQIKNYSKLKIQSKIITVLLFSQSYQIVLKAGKSYILNLRYYI